MMPAGARGTPPGLRLVRDDEPERIVLAHEPPFRIGEAEFRPATREVIFEGVTSIVEPRVMQVLAVLRRADGAVVSKDDLATSCWEGRIVGEDAINRVISRLRGVAEKDAGGAFKVETITKVGYRLVSGESACAAVEDAPVARPSLARREIMIGAGAVAAVAAAGGGWAFIHRDRTPPEAKLLIADVRQSLREASVDQVGNAIAKLRQAIEIAPDNAEAWGLLAFAYMSAARTGPAADREELRARGNTAIQRALSLDPHQPDVLCARILSLRQYLNWYNFEMTVRAALARNPNHPGLNFQLGYLLSQVGRTNEALDRYDYVLSALPMSTSLRVVKAVTLWDLGRLDEAESAITRTFELFPRHYGIWFTRLYFLMYNGRATEAVAMLADKDARPTGIPEWNFDLTGTQVSALAAGDAAEVKHTIELWKKESRRGTGFTELAAVFAGFAGDTDEAYRLLNGLYFNRGFSMDDYYFSKEQGIHAGVERHTFTLFRRPIAAIRRDPRFGAMTRELRLDDYWNRTGSRSQVIV